MFTKRRSSPSSENSRSWNPGCRWSMSASTAATVGASLSTARSPPVVSRRIGGMRTLTAISLLQGMTASADQRRLARQAAELHVVDQLRDRRVVAADRALRVAAQLHLAELHRQRVEQQQPPGQGLAQPQNQLDRLDRLDA